MDGGRDGKMNDQTSNTPLEIGDDDRALVGVSRGHGDLL